MLLIQNSISSVKDDRIEIKDFLAIIHWWWMNSYKLYHGNRRVKTLNHVYIIKVENYFKERKFRMWIELGVPAFSSRFNEF